MPAFFYLPKYTEKLSFFNSRPIPSTSRPPYLNAYITILTLMSSQATGGPTGASTSAGAATTSGSSGKRDKSRQRIALRINYISEQFEADRDVHYREMLHALQSTLSSLHSGKNEEFLEQLADIEEHRDAELTRLNLWEAYQIDCAEQEYQREIAAANEEYTKLTLLVKERLMTRLETQRKRLREDKALLDIANDHMVFLSGSYGYSGSVAQPETEGKSNGTTNGYYSGGASGTPNSPGLGFAFANERRHLRRRDVATASALEDMSGLSGGEGRGGYTSATRGNGSTRDGGATSSGGKRRKVGGGFMTGASGDDMLLSDREALEGILFSKDRDTAGSRHGGGHGSGRQSKSYQPPAPLKNEDVVDDLTQLRAAALSLKRKRNGK